MYEAIITPKTWQTSKDEASDIIYFAEKSEADNEPDKQQEIADSWSQIKKNKHILPL